MTDMSIYVDRISDTIHFECKGRTDSTRLRVIKMGRNVSFEVMNAIHIYTTVDNDSLYYENKLGD